MQRVLVIPRGFDFHVLSFDSHGFILLSLNIGMSMYPALPTKKKKKSRRLLLSLQRSGAPFSSRGNDDNPFTKESSSLKVKAFLSSFHRGAHPKNETAFLPSCFPTKVKTALKVPASGYTQTGQDMAMTWGKERTLTSQVDVVAGLPRAAIRGRSAKLEIRTDSVSFVISYLLRQLACDVQRRFLVSSSPAYR
ncbi:hypothetical protein DM01DRAFT_1179246 [Hesseltinella vesiculosa]|uniref:Uncharacterized protein n=1 Tax=Hesseltinella vesiculosa TaxID=101127 RepID=A0A1X2G494_9FUNG|nr:hypothetical protein DM01DRAFT_1179246 [Hesseltinella vesiculosa]